MDDLEPESEFQLGRNNRSQRRTLLAYLLLTLSSMTSLVRLASSAGSMRIVSFSVVWFELSVARRSFARFNCEFFPAASLPR